MRPSQILLEAGASPNAQTRKGPTPAFVPPCKGTGCGSEGVGINRGGLPDRGRRAEVKGGMTPLLYAARDGTASTPRDGSIAAGADLELADGERHPAAADGRCSTTISTSRACCSSKGANVNADDFWGRSPLWAAVEYRNLDMNNNDQDSPTDNGVDRAPILESDQGAHRRGRQRQRAHARGAAEPALALLARTTCRGWTSPARRRSCARRSRAIRRRCGCCVRARRRSRTCRRWPAPRR